MKTANRYSHLGGYEHIAVHKTWLWSEIEDAIAAVDATACEVRTRQGNVGQSAYDFGLIETALKYELKQRGWIDPRMLQAHTENEATSPRMESFDVAEMTNFVKDRISIETHFSEDYAVTYGLYARHLAFYVGDQIDVGIEILPMKSLQSQMSSGVPYYEKGFYDVVRQGRGVPAVPLVVVGVEP